MFRLLYFVVLVGGLFWIVQSATIVFDPARAVDEPPRAARAVGGQNDAGPQLAETFRRIKITAFATILVVAAGELWVLLVHRLRLFRRI